MPPAAGSNQRLRGRALSRWERRSSTSRWRPITNARAILRRRTTSISMRGTCSAPSSSGVGVERRCRPRGRRCCPVWHVPAPGPMTPVWTWHRLPLLTLALLLASLPARAAERNGILLYGFTSGTPATPQAIAPMVAVLVREELQKGGPYRVRSATPTILTCREPSRPTRPTVDPTQLHHAIRVARSARPQYVVQGLITAYEAP